MRIPHLLVAISLIGAASVACSSGTATDSSLVNAGASAQELGVAYYQVEAGEAYATPVALLAPDGARVGYGMVDHQTQSAAVLGNRFDEHAQTTLSTDLKRVLLASSRDGEVASTQQALPPMWCGTSISSEVYRGCWSCFSEGQVNGWCWKHTCEWEGQLQRFYEYDC